MVGSWRALRESDGTGKGDVKAQIEAAPSHLLIPREAMHHHPGVDRTFLIKDRQDVVVRLSTVDTHR